MTVELLKKLSFQGIFLSLEENGNIKIKSKKGAMNNEYRDQIKKNKAELVQALEMLEKLRGKSDKRKVKSIGETYEVALSHAQKGLWVIQQFDLKSTEYNMPVALKVKGEIDFSALESTFSKIIFKHEILRTNYIEISGSVRGKIRNDHSFKLGYMDCSHLLQHEKSKKVAELQSHEMELSFDLELDLMLRARLLKLDEQEYVLLLTMHHIASDGWSMSILIDEVFSLYSSLLTEISFEANTLDIQYKDYTYWQQQSLQNPGENERGLNYWLERMSGAPALHCLPLDKARPEVIGYRGASVKQSMSKSISDLINGMCRRYSCTNFVFLQTVFAILVARWSNEHDLVVGTVSSGRFEKQLESLIGLFINAIPLRVTLDNNLSFEDLLKKNQENIINDFEYAHIPFEMIVEKVSPQRSQSHSPLFQIVFSLQNQKASSLKTELFDVETIEPEVLSSQYELILNAQMSNNGLLFDCIYNSDVFEKETITRFLNQYCSLLKFIIEHPTEIISRLPIVCPDEQQILLNWSDNTRHGLVPDGLPIYAQVALLAKSVPNHPAVTMRDTTLSYRELDRYVNQLAGFLSEEVSGRNIGVMLPRSPEMLIAILAIMKSGNAYVPIDPDYPQERVQYIIEDASIEYICSFTEHSTNFRLDGCDVIALEECLDGAFEEFENIEVEPQSTRNNLAYILYTSGTTGQPKGVMVSYEGLNNYIRFASENYFLDAIHGAVVSTSVCFDATITSLLAPLAVAKEVILLPEDEGIIESLEHILIESDKNLLFKLTPSHLNALGSWTQHSVLSDNRHIFVVGGEQLTTRTLKQWSEGFTPNAVYVNEYGPTETVVGCSVFVHESGSELPAGASVPIGKPIANTQLYVLNESFQVQPIGCLGELYIGGAGVSEGYLNQPEQTRKNFIELPSIRSGVYYKTGDIVKWDKSGNLVYVGRSDRQVKVAGKRFEIEEIENTILNQSLVKEAIVDLEDNGKLLAYVLLNSDKAHTALNISRVINNSNIQANHLFELSNGLEVFAVNKSEVEYIYEEIFEHQVYSQHGISISDGDCIFDVGANVGMFSIYLATHFRDIKVFGFEPIPQIYEYLSANMSVYCTQFEAINLGLSDRAGKEVFSYYPNASVYSGKNEGKKENIDIVKQYISNISDNDDILIDQLASNKMKTELVDVELSTISEQIDRYGVEQIDLIKIDAERSEYQILCGIKDEHWKIIKQMVVEVHDDGKNLEKVKELISEKGFEITLDQDDSLVGTELFNLYAIKHTNQASTPHFVTESWLGPKALHRQLRQALSQQLPKYMVPSSIYFVDKIPLTRNGKVDYEGLSKLKVESQNESLIELPQTHFQRRICKKWQELLSVEKVGIRDNFFDLGGHSLLAISFLSWVRDELDYNITIKDFFENPTIYLLSDLVESQQFSLTISPILRMDREERIPLSYPQQRLWLIDKVTGQNSEYNIVNSFHLQGNFSKEYFEKALHNLITRHSVFRTKFYEHSGAVYQQTFECAAPDFEFIDISSMEQESKEHRISETYNKELKHSFSFEGDILLRVKLLKLAHNDYVVVFNMHHIASDGWSLRLIIGDFLKAYRALVDGSSVFDLSSEQEYSYGDFANWQRTWMQDSILDEHVSYWQSRLKGAPTIHNLGLDRTRPAQPSFNGKSVNSKICSKKLALIKQYCKANSATLFMFLQTLFALTVARFSNRMDVLIGVPVAGRMHSELENVVGCFLNVVVIRTQIDGNQTFANLLEHSRSNFIADLSYQNIPFEILVERFEHERRHNVSPLFQILFNLDSYDRAEVTSLDMDISFFEQKTTNVKYDLEFNAAESNGELVIKYIYSTDIFDEASIESLNDGFNILLDSVIETANAYTGVLNIPIMQSSQQPDLTSMSTSTSEQSIVAVTPITELIRERALQSPRSTALIYDNEAMTYAELENKANRLARYLGGLGVSQGSVIGICTERTAEMVISILGVLKAGATYVPIDHSLPSQRIQYIVEDSKTELVLCHSWLSALFKSNNIKTVYIDNVDTLTRSYAGVRDECGVSLDNAAYLMYTSGSTGNPKGVIVSHHNLSHFTSSMSEFFSEKEETWLAVTGTGFDISVLELLCTLSYGKTVVIAPEQKLSIDSSISDKLRNLEFSLFYFANAKSNMGKQQGGIYKLLLAGAKFADQNHFKAVWTPERHFDEFGGIYPNPAIISAAVAAVTENIEVRAGSVVLPLNNPIKVAEDWSVIDNLSNGRVGVSFASGWNVNDFVLEPENFSVRKEVMSEGIEVIKSLWKGDTVELKNGEGKPFDVKLYPKPVQSELPIWITAAGNPDTYREAGLKGTNVLTHLLGQTLGELEERIAIYNQAWKQAGHSGKGKVSLMIHAFVGECEDSVVAHIKEPFKEYLKTSLNIIDKSGDTLSRQSDKEIDIFLDAAFKRYYKSSALFGTVDSCFEMVKSLAATGVTELAFLVDFGVDEDVVIEHFDFLRELQEKTKQVFMRPKNADVLDLIKEHAVTHMQCTPSFAQALLQRNHVDEHLSSLQKVLIGGEVFPQSLAKDIFKKLNARVFNMYGPTECTVWSTCYEVTGNETAPISIGQPLNQYGVYVVNEKLQRQPIGCEGELLISGNGVAQGYLNKDVLTKEKFVTTDYLKGERAYRTGDLARVNKQGRIEYLGRNDEQVKIRGHRIELQEITHCLELHNQVKSAATIVQECPEVGPVIISYVVLCDGIGNSKNNDQKILLDLKGSLRKLLPTSMLPNQINALDAIPLNANGKVDKNALQNISSVQAPVVQKPDTETELKLAHIWASLLKRPIESIGLHDNFFELGGHSLLLMRLTVEFENEFALKLSIQEVFENTDLSSLAAKIDEKLLIIQKTKQLKEKNKKNKNARELII